MLLPHILFWPEITPGSAGTFPTETPRVCTEEDPQVLLADTVILPPEVPAIAVILLLVEVPVQPDGKTQVYDVAPDTSGTEYTLDELPQIALFPVIGAGACGARVITLKVDTVEVPQVLLADTFMSPPLGPAFTEILVEFELPVQPPGKVQLYEVAPGRLILILLG